MRVSLFPILVVCLLCAFSATAQKVIEPGSTVAVGDRVIAAVIAVDADGNEGIVNASAELLDTNGDVRSQASPRSVRLTRGRQTVRFEFPFDANSDESNDDLTWYRLRYRVGNSSGIISLSQMLPDLFELRIIAGEYLMTGITYRVRVRALNPITGLPAEGVDVALEVKMNLKGDGDRQITLNGKGRTDADGFAAVDFAIPPETQLDDDGDIRVVGRKNGIIREAEEDLDTTRSDVQFLMMTDKPIYQPEQEVHLRGILMKGSQAKTITSDTEIEFRITDQDDTLLFREKVVTSTFGIAAVSWRIPANARLGNYRIEVRDRDGEQIASERVKVTRYDLPNFAVNATPAKPFYLAEDKEVEIEIRADYLFGKPVTKGKVRVVEEKSREWNWKEQKYDVDEGAVREGELDEKGVFKAKFEQGVEFDEDDRDWYKYRDVKYAAYVTDTTTNKTEQRRFDVRVSREPIHVYYISNRYSQNPSLPIDGYISTFYADGTPAACDIEIKASLENEKRFRTIGTTRTSSFGAGRVSLARPRMGEKDDDLDLQFIARDGKGGRGTIRDEDISFDEDRQEIRLQTNKTIYKPGEAIEAEIRSTIKEGTVYVDIVDDWSVVDSQFASLKNGRARLKIPYRKAFKGELSIAAFIEDPDDRNDLVAATRGIIFPARKGIIVEANFDRASYKPNEEARVSIGVKDAGGRAAESALGIVVLDRAVEERARTDAEFGGMFSGLGGWLGYGRGFGSVNVKDLNEMDLSKPISQELQLVAEVMLANAYYEPNVFRSDSYYESAGLAFSSPIRRQFAPVEKALRDAYSERDFLHATDADGLRQILLAAGIDLDKMTDPWETPYRAGFSVAKEKNFVAITSAGPDKQFDTKDDFVAMSQGFEYFRPIGIKIDKATRGFYERTGDTIRDERTLLGELGLEELRDRFGTPYKFVFDSDGRWVDMYVRSAGPDRKLEERTYYGDDFEVWRNRIDHFAMVEKRIIESQNLLKTIPSNEAEFKASLTNADIIFDSLRDANGHPLYITAVNTSRYWDKVTLETVQKFGEKERTERRKITPVTQQIIQFTIRSVGKDGQRGTWDDRTLTQIVHILSERSKDDPKPVSVIRPVAYYANTGSISGTVTDANGASVFGANVTATNHATGLLRSASTDDEGRFLIAALPVGSYSVRAEAAGFKSTIISAVPVTAGATNSLQITLEAGSVSSMVEVTVSGLSVETSSTSSSIVGTRTISDLPRGTNFQSLLKLAPGVQPEPLSAGFQVDGASGSEQVFTIDGKDFVKDSTGKLIPYQPKATPRLREYFPETLLWSPEVITDKDGKATIRFRMADNITTWKMYTIASTKNGKIGVADKEVTAFQSFFVDLDPPKFLTDGDEIFLPTQVRNYTDAKQKVDVTMAKADWFSFLDAEKKQVEVASGETQNAVFGFKAAMPVKDGRQRVTAAAETDSDAIEKPVTVRPDGREVVETDSRYVTGSERIDVNFPAEMLPGTQKAELKIYPNLIAHVAESVEGLLQRPYGCGEQTISSTYPNVMILKFAGEGEQRRIPAATMAKARKYLQDGYDRLIGYQTPSGGFSYWGAKDTPDIALTAYALRFLSDASAFVAVDQEIATKAGAWLASRQLSDGSWNWKYTWETEANPRRAKTTTTYVARTLAMLKTARKESAAAEKPDPLDAVLAKALEYLKVRNAEIDDPYSLALYGLASLDSGDNAAAKAAAEKLAGLAITEGTGIYWNLESNTAFNGWGTAGRIESSALATQLLMRMNSNRAFDPLIGKAMVFLVKNKDRYGVWYSTQTTINVLDAFVTAMSAGDGGTTQTVEVVVNGTTAETLEIGPDKLEQIIVPLDGKLNAGENAVELRVSGRSPLMAQIVRTHYVGWQNADASGRSVNQSRAIELDYKCDRTSAAIMQEVSCSVSAERIGFRGYGMLLAEIGTPPGADVSRESLEAALEADWSLSKYEVLPDRIIFYMWAKAGGTKFNFKFKPRYGINAQTPASVVYDYYNPEAQAVGAPLRFSVR